MGVVSLNLVNIGLSVQENKEDFWDLLNERLCLCKEALLVRYNLLKGTKSDVSPIHWQHGGIARLKPGQVIDPLLENGYATISLGYVGLYELTQVMLGVSHTEKEGTDFALKVMNKLKHACDEWKKETGLGFGLYGTPAESTVYNFCRKDKTRFGEVLNVTDKQYYTNSYHVFVGEEIDAFSKLKFESQFHSISSGGCISYVEVPNMTKNIDGVKALINYIYHNVQYAEINSRPDVCFECNYSGEMNLTNNKWICPNCKNDDHNKMQVMRRTCGYISTNTWNKGKLEEISERVLHVD